MILGGLILSIQVPFVVWSPGQVSDLYGRIDGRPVVSLSGVETYRTSGQILVTDLDVSAPTVSLLTAMSAFFNPDHDLLPQAVSYPVGQPIVQVAVGQRSPEAQRAAEAAALILASEDVTQVPVSRVVRVMSVEVGGASYGRLLPGDVLSAIGSTSLASVAEFSQAMSILSVGDTVQLTVIRNGKLIDTQINVVIEASVDERQAPSLGVTVSDSFLLGDVDITGAPDTMGSDLILALAIYDLVTPGDLLKGRTVAGTGILDSTGAVSPVAGARQQLLAAQIAGADVFLLPAGNCANVPNGLTMTVIAVTTLADTVDSLAALVAGSPSSALPTCSN